MGQREVRGARGSKGEQGGGKGGKGGGGGDAARDSMPTCRLLRCNIRPYLRHEFSMIYQPMIVFLN